MTNRQVLHWNRHAHLWRDIGPPLRPGVQDVEFMRETISRRRSSLGSAPRGLLLGVTPEIARIEWHPALTLLAVDQSPAMIADAWPGNTTTRRAVRGDWFALPVGLATVDVVLADGCFNALEYPRGYRRLARSIADVLRPGGLLVLRLFCRPERSETVDAVIGDLDAGRIESFHVLKWRLAMAVQGEDATSGVRLGDLWDVCSARLPSDEALAARTGWPLAHMRTLDGYRDSNGSYTFPRLSEVLATLSGDFERLEQWCGGYQLGERCPHLVFRRVQMP